MWRLEAQHVGDNGLGVFPGFEREEVNATSQRI